MSDSLGMGAQELSRQLEDRLEAARRAKGLAQVPAVRRLRNSVRVLLVLGMMGSLLMLLAGAALRSVRTQVAAQDFEPSRQVAFAFYVVVMGLSLTLSWLLVYAELRFLRQFKRSHLTDLRQTAGLLVRILAYTFALGIAALPINFFLFRGRVETFASTSGSLGGLGYSLALFLFVRYYVRTAEADLDALQAATGEEGPRGHYARWRSALLVCGVVALLDLGIGYAVSGVLAAH